MDKNNIRIGILGMGSIAREHAGALLGLPGVEITALCAAHPENAQKYKDEKGLDATVYADGFEMIEKAPVDALYICLPPFAHEGQLEAAAAGGLPMFVEKPLALTRERAESMCRAVAKAGVVAQMGFHMRFSGPVQKIKAMLADGSAGTPLLYTANYECNSLHTHWWMNKDKSGGQVYEQALHLYDLSAWFLGAPQKASGFISNQCHQNVPGYTVEDTSAAALLFEQGRLASITATNCAVKNEWNGRFRLVCSKLIADVPDLNHATFTYTGGEEKRVEEVTFEQNAIKAENEYFISVLRGENPPVSPLTDGLLDLKLVSAVMRSAEAGGQSMTIDA